MKTRTARLPPPDSLRSSPSSKKYTLCHDQRMCVFVYEVDTETEPARDRRPMSFTEIYLAHVGIDDFRSNPRGELGMRTATLHRDGVRKLREHWVYRV